MNKNPIPNQSGFSLIEILVGLVIGLIATLVIVNVFSVFESQKRVTTGSSDAQTNGSIALFTIQRDMQHAGFGLPVYGQGYSPFNCAANIPLTDTIPAPAGVRLFPVAIANGTGANGGDVVTIRSGTTMRGGAAVTMTQMPVGNSIQITNVLGCSIGDVALIINPTNNACETARITGINVATNQVSFPNTFPNLALGNIISCLGGWNEFSYAVDANNQLTRSGVPIVTDVVNIQAQYGISAAPTDNRVTQWVDASNAWNNSTRIKSVRIAIVARSGLMQPNNVTAQCSSLTAPNPTGLCAWDGSVTGSPAPAINLNADPNWQRYRYRVYESIIPLRNVIWQRSRL